MSYILPTRGSNEPITGAEGRTAVRKFLATTFGIPFATLCRARLADLVSAYHDTSDASAKALLAGGFVAPAAPSGVLVDTLEDTPDDIVVPDVFGGGTIPAECVEAPEDTDVSDVSSEEAHLLSVLRSAARDKTARDLAEKALDAAKTFGKLSLDGLKKLEADLEKLASEGLSVKGLDPDVLKKLADILSSTSGPGLKRLPVAVAAAKGDPIADVLSRFYEPGRALVQPVLLTSPPSFGKSFSVKQLAKAYDVFLEHGCTDSPDEFEGLIGGPVAAGEEGFIVVDGKLTAAVRAASGGRNALLLLDEVLRWPHKVQESLLTFLQPFVNADGDEVYRLTTRHRATGGFEVLECKTSHFHIVAAANLSFARPVEAFWSRFVLKRFDFSVAFAEKKGREILDYHGITDCVEELAKKFAKLLDDTRKGVFSRLYQFPADFRLLVTAIRLSDGTKVGIGKVISELLADKIAKWDAESADSDKESYKEATTLARAFEASLS